MPISNNRLERIPNDPHYRLLWALPTIQATRAWAYSTGDPSIIIAIVDTGVELDHPDLQSKLWTNSDEIPGNGLDDANGFVDDVHSYAFGRMWPHRVRTSIARCKDLGDPGKDNALAGAGSRPTRL